MDPQLTAIAKNPASDWISALPKTPAAEIYLALIENMVILQEQYKLTEEKLALYAKQIGDPNLTETNGERLKKELDQTMDQFRKLVVRLQFHTEELKNMHEKLGENK